MTFTPVLGEVKGLGLIVPYLGSKRQLLPKILPILPPHNRYVELMGGSGAVFFAKPPARESVLNDLDAHLIGFYRKFSCAALEKCEEDQTKVCAFARKARERVRKGSGNVCDQIAARRFSIVSNVTSGMKTDECRGQPIVTRALRGKCREFEGRLRRAKLTNLDYRDAFRKFDAPDSLTFIDPPYPGTAKPSQVPGMPDPREVCALARTAKGKVLITYGDTPEIRSACAGLHMKSVASKHRAAHVTKSPASRRELLIANFPIEARARAVAGASKRR